MRPNFGDLYTEHWPHPDDEGVGIRMTGKPSERSAFIRVLAHHYCPLNLAHKHAEKIFAEGVVMTTVLANVDFPALERDLKTVGISLAIIPPRGYKSPV